MQSLQVRTHKWSLAGFAFQRMGKAMEKTKLIHTLSIAAILFCIDAY